MYKKALTTTLKIYIAMIVSTVGVFSGLRWIVDCFGMIGAVWLVVAIALISMFFSIYRGVWLFQVVKKIQQGDK